MGLDPQQIKAIEEATGHSVFGSSSLPRIVECPASVGMELKAGLKPESVYAAKGTELHKYTERALRSPDPKKTLYSFPLSIEDTVYVEDAVDYVYRILQNHTSDVVVMTPNEDGTYEMSAVESMVADGRTVMLLEVTGSLASYGIPESYGTSDVVIRSARRTDVIDHKFGHGVAVFAKENYQLVGYLGMAIPFRPHYDPDHRMFVHINQPTLNIFDEWEVSPDRLLQMLLGDVTDAIAKAKGDDPPFGPSQKACRFCNANKGCQARHNSLVGQAKLIQQLSKDPSTVSNAQWAQFLEAAESLEEAISGLKKYAVAEIQAGREFPGFKLIASKANRKYIDEDAAREFLVARLGKRAFKEPELVSLAQAEKVDKTLKADPAWKDLIFTPEGAPKLAKITEKGEALAYGVGGLMQRIAAGVE